MTIKKFSRSLEEGDAMHKNTHCHKILNKPMEINTDRPAAASHEKMSKREAKISLKY